MSYDWRCIRAKAARASASRCENRRIVYRRRRPTLFADRIQRRLTMVGLVLTAVMCYENRTEKLHERR